MENCKPHITLRDSQLRGDNGDTYNKSDSHPRQIYRSRPYMGNDLSVDPNKYFEEKVENYNLDEETLNNFIHRIVLSCVLQEVGENGEDRIAKPEADSVVSPSEHRPVLYSEGNTKQRKRDKQIKKSKKLEKKEEEKLFEDVSRYNTYSTEKTITLPVSQFRKMVNDELESRAKEVHRFYQHQWNQSQDDRIRAYGSVIVWKDRACKYEYLYVNAQEELRQLQDSYEALKNELNSIKDAKRKRRHAAKSRRNNKDRNNNDDDENKS